MEKLKQIIRNHSMNTRPEFYSGRGATLSDLNGEILFGIHKDLKKEFGKKAGIGFVKMVNGITVLSATAFLNGLYDLFYNNWKYNEKQPDQITIPKDKDGNYNQVIAGIGIMESLFSKGRNDTQKIKYHFLYKNGIEPKVEYMENGFCFYTYY